MTSTQTSDKSDYENYVIQSNIELRDENKRVSEENNEITVRCDELEDEISKEEQRKTYMKGLMHNLYFMKCESTKVSKLYETSLSDYYKYSEHMNNTYSHITPNMLSAIQSINYVHIVFLFPIIACYFEYITMLETSRIIVFQFIPFPLLYIYVKYVAKKTEIYIYYKIKKKYHENKKTIREMSEKIREVEDSCRSLDDYIDEV
jgi:hypothetical protein